MLSGSVCQESAVVFVVVAFWVSLSESAVVFVVVVVVVAVIVWVYLLGHSVWMWRVNKIHTGHITMGLYESILFYPYLTPPSQNHGRSSMCVYYRPWMCVFYRPGMSICWNKRLKDERWKLSWCHQSSCKKGQIWSSSTRRREKNFRNNFLSYRSK